jgi:hypothetical protein
MRTQFFSGKMFFSLLTLTLCFGFTTMSYSNAVVSVQPTTLEAPEVGEHLTLHVDITGGESVAGYQFTVAYDTTALRYVNATNADYLASNTFAMPLPEMDTLTLVAVVLKDAPLSAGDGTLATLTFEVLAVKPFGVHLTDVILCDATPAGLAVRWTDTRFDGTLDMLPAAQTSLLGNYPNPFNPETWIPYQLAEAADVTLTIYGADGKLVRSIILGHQPAGLYHRKGRAAYWDGRNDLGERVASGLYFYTLTTGDFTATGRMLILK